jgi:hypothetical protein
MWIGIFHICIAIATTDPSNNCISMFVRNQPTIEACYAAMDLFIEAFAKRGPSPCWVPVKECQKAEPQG